MWSAPYIVFVRNRKWISDFRGVQIHILAVKTRFSNISAKFRVEVKIEQR